MKRAITAAVLALLAACEAPPPASTRALTEAIVSPSSSAAVTIPGYQHQLQNSRFNPGSPSAAVTESGFNKIVGPTGTFATNVINGTVIALSNAGSPAMLAAPLGSGETHNAAVRSYFVNAGLPDGQIGNVDLHPMMKGGKTKTGTRLPDSLVGYYSVLSREINRAPVAESFAWARFDANGDVVAESVYWPPLPGSVTADVAAFNALVSDAGSLATLTATIEASNPGYGSVPGRVVIHHADSTYRGQGVAVVTYDSLKARDSLGMREVRHFDVSGARVILAHELPQAQTSSR